MPTEREKDRLRRPDNRLARIQHHFHNAQCRRAIPRGQGPVVRSPLMKEMLQDQADLLLYMLNRESGE